MLTLDQLTAAVEDGSVDTVLVAFTDMQGRLQGKRCAADYFLDEVAPHAAEACNYLLAVDVEPGVARFVEAFVEGMRFYRNKANKDENLRILAKYLRLPLDKQRAALEEGYETYRDVMLRKPYADPQAMKLLLEIVAESNPKAKSVNLASLVDSSFVDKLDREGVLDK
jgi:glutamine synthetase